MTKPVKVILNPYSNRWRALEKRLAMELALKQAGIQYDLAITERPRQGTELAAQAVQQGFELIISAGGDGSINEVVNGILSVAPPGSHQPSLGIIPLGTANDLAVNLGLPMELAQSALQIARGKTRFMDLGKITFFEDPQAKTPTSIQYFGNNSAIGLEPTVTLIQQRITNIHGTPRYVIAALAGIMQNPQWKMSLEWYEGSYSGPVTLVSVGNHRLTGGVFYMTPHANGFDGLLTFVYGAIPTRRQILAIFPRTMKPDKGSYIEHPNIHEIHTPWLRIVVDHPTPLHADGEIQSTKVLMLEYNIIPGAIPVMMES